MAPFPVWLASIPSPDSGTIDVGPLRLHMYGLLLGIGVLVASWIGDRRWRGKGLRPETAVWDIAVWVVIGGVVGARAYHLFTGYDWEGEGLGGTIRIWEGGLSIWGVLIGGAAALVVTCVVRHIDFVAMMDAVAPGILAAQAIGRWGNWFNQELFGKPTELPWGLEIDPQHRPAGYERYETFHPTYLYESLYCAALFAFLLWAERRFRFRRGQMFTAYISLYSGGRFFFENLRIDKAEVVFGLRWNAWVSLLAFVAFGLWSLWFARNGRPYDEVTGSTRPLEETPSE